MAVQASSQLVPSSLPSITTSAPLYPPPPQPYSALGSAPAPAALAPVTGGQPQAAGVRTPCGIATPPASVGGSPPPCALAETGDVWRGTSIASLRRKALEHTASMFR